MIFRKRPVEPVPKPVYSYEVYPGDVNDGSAFFDDIEVKFTKPGWRWMILEMTQWAMPVMMSDKGFATRDAALVDLLKAAREMDADGDKDNTYI